MTQQQNDSLTFHFHDHTGIDGRAIAHSVLDRVCNPTSSEPAPSLQCGNLISRLEQAGHFDLDFDAEKSTLSLVALWAANDASHFRAQAARQHQAIAHDDRVEVGVLEAQQAKKQDELSLGGYLTVLGEDSRPSSCSPYTNSESS